MYEGGVLDHLALSSQLDLSIGGGNRNRSMISIIAGWRLAGEQLVGEKIIVAGEGTTFPRMQHEGWFLSVGVSRHATETLTGVQEGN
jgi:hypothetical protein